MEAHAVSTIDCAAGGGARLVAALTVSFASIHQRATLMRSLACLQITLCGWVDWSIYYIGGLTAVFRFSRPFRPLLGISKRKSLRR